MVLLLALCAGSAAQTGEERPPVPVPEPERRTRVPAAEGPFVLTLVEYPEAVAERDLFPSALGELVRFAREQTQLEVKLRWNKLSLQDRHLGESLMLYMSGHDAALRLNEVEKEKLGQYLREGGFLFAEDVVPGDGRGGPPRGGGVEGTPFDRQFKALMRDPLVLGSQGKRWRKVSKDAPLYSMYFDFPDGPPRSGAPNGNVFDLEMLELRGRVAVIFSDLNISWYWSALEAEGRDRSLQFGVNLVVFALAKHFAGQPLPLSR